MMMMMMMMMMMLIAQKQLEKLKRQIAQQTEVMQTDTTTPSPTPLIYTISHHSSAPSALTTPNTDR